MVGFEQNAEQESYRLVLITSDSLRPLAARVGSDLRLPKIQILRWTRTAEQVQQVVRNTFGLNITVLGILLHGTWDCGSVIAEVCSGDVPRYLASIDWSQISEEDLNQSERQAAQNIVFGDNRKEANPFSRPGWIKEACEWLRGACPGAEILPDSIRQYNAGARFSLLRFATRDGSAYWLKATGPPNQHEFDLTYLFQISAQNICRTLLQSVQSGTHG